MTHCWRLARESRCPHCSRRVMTRTGNACPAMFSRRPTKKQARRDPPEHRPRWPVTDTATSASGVFPSTRRAICSATSRLTGPGSLQHRRGNTQIRLLGLVAIDDDPSAVIVRNSGNLRQRPTDQPARAAFGKHHLAAGSLSKRATRRAAGGDRHDRVQASGFRSAAESSELNPEPRTLNPLWLQSRREFTSIKDSPQPASSIRICSARSAASFRTPLYRRERLSAGRPRLRSRLGRRHPGGADGSG